MGFIDADFGWSDFGLQSIKAEVWKLIADVYLKTAFGRLIINML